MLYKKWQKLEMMLTRWRSIRRNERHKFREYFNSIREEQNLRKVAKLLYVFVATPDEVEKYVESNYSDNCILNNYDFESF